MAAPAGNGGRRRSRFASMEFIGEAILLLAVGAFFVYMYWDSVDKDVGAWAWLPWRLDWSNPGWLLPRLAIFFGAPFWLWRAATILGALDWIERVVLPPIGSALSLLWRPVRRVLQLLWRPVRGVLQHRALNLPRRFLGRPLLIVWRAIFPPRAAAVPSEAASSEQPKQIMDTGFLETTDAPSVVALRWVQLFVTTAALLLGIWIIGFHIAVPAYTVLYLIIFGKAKWYWTIIPAAFILIVVNFIYGYLLIAEWGNPVARDWPIIGSIWDAAVNVWHNAYDSFFDPN